MFTTFFLLLWNRFIQVLHHTCVLVRLGLLKVLNDCIGFAGPLAWLLNKLFRFLQQGSGHLDGYVLAMSLGLTEAY